MEDREIGLFWREWFLEKQKDSQASPEDYLIRTYLECMRRIHWEKRKNGRGSRNGFRPGKRRGTDSCG